MKVGDTFILERLPYLVTAVHRAEVTLKRRAALTLSDFRRRLKQKRWRRLVSSNFLIDARTGQTYTNYELMAAGMSIGQINRYHYTLPVITEQEAAR